MKKKKNLMALLFGVCALLVSNSLFAQGEAEIDSGATAWMLTSTALVLLMVPGLAMFYGGLVRTKNVLGTMMHSFAAMGVMSVLWVVIMANLPWNMENTYSGTPLMMEVSIPERNT